MQTGDTAQFQPLDGPPSPIIPVNIGDHGLHIFLIGQRISIAVAAPEVGLVDVGRFKRGNTCIMQSLYGLGNGVYISSMDAHGCMNKQSPLSTKATDSQGGFLRAGNASHPIMPAYTVKTNGNAGLDSAAGKRIQNRFIQQPAVGIELADYHAVGENAVHELPEILAHKRLAAG